LASRADFSMVQESPPGSARPPTKGAPWSYTKTFAFGRVLAYPGPEARPLPFLRRRVRPSVSDSQEQPPTTALEQDTCRAPGRSRARWSRPLSLAEPQFPRSSVTAGRSANYGFTNTSSNAAIMDAMPVHAERLNRSDITTKAFLGIEGGASSDQG